MAQRKVKTTSIEPLALTVAAFKAVRCAADYHWLGTTTETSNFQAAWQSLSIEEQQRIINIVNNNAQPDLQAIADELSACGTLIQLQAVKSTYGDAVKAAWKLLPPSERERLTAICQGNAGQPNQSPELTADSTKVEQVEPVQAQPKRTLFSISHDLEKLNELLDECGDDTEQQQLLTEWLEHLGEERDQKLDNYAALISELTYRAAARQAEAQRLMELAQVDENRARLLKERLKWLFETHNLKTVETARYKLQMQRNGGKAPLVLNESVPVTELPQQFQRVNIEPDTAAIRSALEGGETLEFARLGDRGTSIRIK